MYFFRSPPPPPPSGLPRDICIVGILYYCPQSFGLPVWQCHNFLSRLLANNHFTRASRLSDKCVDEMNPEAVHRSPSIYLTVEENPGKSHLGKHLKALRSVIATNGVSLSPNDVDRIARQGRRKERIKGLSRKIFYFILFCFVLFFGVHGAMGCGQKNIL